MLGNQIEGKIIKQACEWDDHIVMIWDYEGHMSYISQAKKRENMMCTFFCYQRNCCTRTSH
jgi:hypothetical protein